jgi:hypothetical protein
MGSLKISDAGLGLVARRAYSTADPPPHVDFIGKAERQGKAAGAVVPLRGREIGLISRQSLI